MHPHFPYAVQLLMVMPGSSFKEGVASPHSSKARAVCGDWANHPWSNTTKVVQRPLLRESGLVAKDLVRGSKSCCRIYKLSLFISDFSIIKDLHRGSLMSQEHVFLGGHRCRCLERFEIVLGKQLYISGLPRPVGTSKSSAKALCFPRECHHLP